MANYKPKACEQCGTEFTSRQPNAKYCTSTCRDRAKYLRTKNSPTPAHKSNAQDVTKHSRRTTHSPHTAQRNAKRQPKQGGTDSKRAPIEKQQVKPAQYAIPHSLQTPPQPSIAPAHAGKKPNAKPTENSCANGEQKTQKRTPSDANEKTPNYTSSAHTAGESNTPTKRKPKLKPTAKQTAHQRASECVDG